MKTILLGDLLSGQVLLPFYHCICPPPRELHDLVYRGFPFDLQITDKLESLGDEPLSKKMNRTIAVHTICIDSAEEEYNRPIIHAVIIEGDFFLGKEIEIALEPEDPRRGYFIFKNPDVSFIEDDDLGNSWKNNTD